MHAYMHIYIYAQSLINFGMHWNYKHPGPPQDTPGCPDTAADIPLFGHYVREAIQDMVYPVFLYPSGYSKNIKHPGYISGILFEKLTYPGHIHRIFTWHLVIFLDEYFNPDVCLDIVSGYSLDMQNQLYQNVVLNENFHH